MLLKQIQTDLAIALKAKNPAVVSILRFLLAEIHNREIQKQAKLTDEDVVGVIRQQNKQQRESIEAYQKGNRDDLVAKEKEELEILSKYLPQQLPTPELEKIVKEVISQTGATGPGDFGKVMGMVMGKIKGQIDGARVAEMVKQCLK